MKKCYIVYKEARSSFGGIIDIDSGRCFIIPHVPRKYLTLTKIEYVVKSFSFKYYYSIPIESLEVLSDLSDFKSLKGEISKILAINISWIYIK